MRVCKEVNLPRRGLSINRATPLILYYFSYFLSFCELSLFEILSRDVNPAEEAEGTLGLLSK